ncbi:MAG: DNA repair protein RecO [Myxococcota bacterium]|jgi:DNA repair protein RecO (recombination protein O)|nr:DNA repair protein RecO [Myxococcota bacterium]
MTAHATSAIVLRTVDVGETDCIVHLLTPDLGRVAAMAKSARKSRKRFPGTLDLLNRLDVELAVRPRRMTHIGRAKLVTAHLGIRSDPTRFAVACRLAELLGRMAPEGGAGGDAARLHAFACHAFDRIETLTPDAKLRLFLQLESLCALGLRPELSACVRCGKALAGGAAFPFHLGDGGVHCGDCRAAAAHEGGTSAVEGATVPVHLGTLRALDHGLRLGFEQLHRLSMGAREMREAEQLVGRFQRFHVGLELRSEMFLNETFASALRP